LQANFFHSLFGIKIKKNIIMENQNWRILKLIVLLNRQI
jgi:hypothetical protein